MKIYYKQKQFFFYKTKISAYQKDNEYLLGEYVFFHEQRMFTNIIIIYKNNKKYITINLEDMHSFLKNLRFLEWEFSTKRIIYLATSVCAIYTK